MATTESGAWCNRRIVRRVHILWHVSLLRFAGGFSSLLSGPSWAREIVGHRPLALVLLESSRASLGLPLASRIVVVLEGRYISIALVARWGIRRLGQHKIWIRPLHSLALLLPLALLLLLASEVEVAFNARQARLMVKIHLGARVWSPL